MGGDLDGQHQPPELEEHLEIRRGLLQLGEGVVLGQIESIGPRQGDEPDHGAENQHVDEVRSESDPETGRPEHVEIDRPTAGGGSQIGGFRGRRSPGRTCGRDLDGRGRGEIPLELVHRGGGLPARFGRQPDERARAHPSLTAPMAQFLERDRAVFAAVAGDDLVGVLHSRGDEPVGREAGS